ncbi:hypothetical protein [Kitasatospora sp. NPDC091207]|uniref:hypothetical protein n=1 Tax=Kitasatospora sp. NPDC091207 TaxID=3364083 RepID=UPI00380A19B3
MGTAEREVPPRVAAAERAAAEAGFKKSCIPRVGRLLSLAAAAKPGGILDDFTPSSHWPPRYGGEVDELRLFYLTHPALCGAEVLTTPFSSAVVATRRP